MGWTSIVSSIFGGGGVVKALENVALEAITTDQESAEAKALMVKTLDPNGMMRRETMRFVCRVYGFYLVVSVVLIFMGFFVNSEAATASLDAITKTFLPITGLFGSLATASFGVNVSNNWKDVKSG